jgi:predicted RNA-binding Zn ribbon-like protein
MIRRDHLEHVLGTVTALVNTAPQAANTEQLGDLLAVRQFIADRIITEVEKPTQADIAALHALRTRLRAIFTAPDEESRVQLVNAAVMAAAITPRLVDHDGMGMHFHFFPPYAPLAEHLNADCAMAIAMLFASGDGGRLRVCAAPDCSRVMVDLSRNRSRTYCDNKTCGNRIHVAAYRARLRA